VIEGVELEGAFQLGRGSSLSFGGHLLSGRDNAERPLGDIPADRFFLGGHWVGDGWGLRGRWEHRAAKSDPGSGEKSIPAANLVTAGLSYAVSEDLELRLSSRNLLDEEYFNSADRKVPYAAGRSVAFSLAWEKP
jgi:outer membrane receptor protein involved in Fe transport